MLILTRRPGEAIVINNNIRLEILKNDEREVRIGIDAPLNIPIHREEIQMRINMANINVEKIKK